MPLDAERPAGIERQVPAEAEARVGGRDDAVVHDQPVADARADRDHGERGPAADGAEPLLGRRERGHVVLDRDRDAEPFLQPVGERDVAPAEERGAGDDALVGDVAADADAEPRHLRTVGGTQPLDQVGHGLDDDVDVVSGQASAPRGRARRPAGR